MVETYNITILQGATWSLPIRKTEALQSVSSMTISSSTVTCVVNSHDFAVGDKVFVSGADQDVYDGVQTILSVVDDNTFTYDVSYTTIPSSPATGTIKVGRIVDLTGFTARMQARLSTFDDATLFDLTTENGGITIDGVNGLVTCSLTASESSLLDFSEGVYDLEIVSGSDVERLLQGKVKLSREVTK